MGWASDLDSCEPRSDAGLWDKWMCNTTVHCRPVHLRVWDDLFRLTDLHCSIGPDSAGAFDLFPCDALGAERSLGGGLVHRRASGSVGL